MWFKRPMGEYRPHDLEKAEIALKFADDALANAMATSSTFEHLRAAARHEVLMAQRQADAFHARARSTQDIPPGDVGT